MSDKSMEFLNSHPLWSEDGCPIGFIHLAKLLDDYEEDLKEETEEESEIFENQTQ